MCFFKRKEKQQEPAPCNHKYKRFRNTILITYNETHNWAKMITTAHFVCIHCKYHKEVELSVANTSHWKDEATYTEERKRLILERPDEYASINKVMGEIAEFQLVDREYLEAARKVFPNSGI